MTHSAVRAMLKRFDAQPLKRHPPETPQAVEATAAGLLERHEGMSGTRRSAAVAALTSLAKGANDSTFSSSRTDRKRKSRSAHNDQQEEAEQKEESASKVPRASLDPVPREPDAMQIDDGEAPALEEKQAAMEEKEQEGQEEEQQQQVADAVATSQANLPTSPRLSAPSRAQHQVYADRIHEELQARELQLHTVPGDGNCLLASVLLGCQAIGIDVCKERGLKRAHASCLRPFLAAWIRQHKQLLFDLSGGDESWRGEAVALGRNGSFHVAKERLTLDGCLELFADQTLRAYDIPWRSMQPGAAPTNLCDYFPQLLAVALELRIVLIKTHGPAETVGMRDKSGELVADASRQVVLVQSIRQNHWNAALPLHPVTAVAAAAVLSSPPRSSSSLSAACAATPATPATPSSVATSADLEWRNGASARRRIFADPPAADAAQAQGAFEHAAQQPYEEAEAATKAVVRAMCRIQELVTLLQRTHQNHKARVRDCALPDADGDVLREMLALQAAVPFPCDGGPPCFYASSSMVEEWTSDIEDLEAALGTPFHPTSPEPVDDVAAKQVCQRLSEWLLQMQDAESEPSFMAMLLLMKKLLCVDQLRPPINDDEQPPHQVFELHALFCRLLVEPRVWSFALRLPCSSFDGSKAKAIHRAADNYVAASRAAAPDLIEQVRLLVEQCKMLAQYRLLHKAKALDSVQLEYPEEPLTVLQELHQQYPDAGPSITRSVLHQWDEELEKWQAKVNNTERKARKLERRVQRGDSRADPAAAQQARAKANMLAASAEPRGFAQCMNKSRMFFHSDKRGRDQATDASTQTSQFSQVKDAWDRLSACRLLFRQLRGFRAAVAE